MKIGIVGLPNVGKSTLFKAITKKQVDINNYPFCTIEPNVGVVEVPDEGLDKLAEMSKSKKVVHAVVEFVDIAGLVKGAAEGEGLGNKFLANIREVDAIVQVVRAFENPNIVHVHNKINPLDDVEVINAELILADLETVNKRIEKLEREAKKNDKESIAKLEINKKIKEILETGELANNTELNKDDKNTRIAIKELSLLTMKPFLYVYNVSDPVKFSKENDGASIKKSIGGASYIALDIKIEEEIDEMSDEEKKELGVESGLDKLIVESYKILNLITFLTTGEDESRAWTIKRNSIAPEAGAAIHNDFKDTFVCADVIRWDKLLKFGSMSKAKEAGEVKTVGKEYIVQDGDVIEFKAGK